MFHTSRWDYDYTGADLEHLSDKRVGIVGTGATAIQCVPHLAAAAQQLFVFQRTPSSVDVRDNQPTDPQWAAGVEPGWQQRRIENFQILTAGGQADEDLVADAWTSITRKLPVMRWDSDGESDPEQRAQSIELADFAKMEEIRARVDAIVSDPATAEALKPWYGYFCKRPCFHDEYLQTFNRDNVTLVDTRGLGVERITAEGVVVDGVHHELDCLIFATGFRGWHRLLRVAPASRSIGRDGLTLTDKWRDGVRTFQGLTVRGFPNCFIESIAQSGFHRELPVPAGRAGPPRRVDHRLGARTRHRPRSKPSAAAEAAWVDTVVRAIGRHRRAGQDLHAGLLQPRRSGGRENPAGQLLLRRTHRIRGHPRNLACPRTISTGLEIAPMRTPVPRSAG